MQKQPALISFLSRLGLAIAGLSFLYLRFGPPSYEETEMLNALIYLLILPFILISSTIVACFIAGGMITLIPRIFKWWYARPFVALMLIIIGICLSYVSVSPGIILTETSPEGIKQIPDWNYIIPGWFITGFALTQFYISAFVNGIEKIFNRKTNKSSVS